jgi:hypothetical protein
MTRTAKRRPPAASWPCRAAGGAARGDGKCAQCLADPGEACRLALDRPDELAATADPRPAAGP